MLLLSLLKTLKEEDYQDGNGKIIPFLQANSNKERCNIFDTNDLIFQLKPLETEGKQKLRHMFENPKNPGPIISIKLLKKCNIIRYCH